jgi:structural maintenance of chromosomes protein 5
MKLLSVNKMTNLESNATNDDEQILEGLLIPLDTRDVRADLLSRRFPPGSILRLSMKNFVTYTSAEFYPGPNMNLVIGPNGSGKSTIVCAICLGLGYNPNVLGRATSVGDYVQHGKESAEIEIELAQENGDSIVIKRRIKRDKNQSTYYLNGIPPPSRNDC